jgi:tRNA(fMet)-specific endonuclease VapC
VKYILDTNAVSALMLEDAPTIDRLAREDRIHVAVPQPVFAEIAYGIARLPKSKRKDALAGRFRLLRSEIRGAVWSDAVTDAFGEVKAALEHAGKRIEDFDAAIAAHAIAYRAVLVTTNLKHMSRVPNLAIENWAKPG